MPEIYVVRRDLYDALRDGVTGLAERIDAQGGAMPAVCMDDARRRWWADPAAILRGELKPAPVNSSVAVVADGLVNQ